MVMLQFIIVQKQCLQMEFHWFWLGLEYVLLVLQIVQQTMERCAGIVLLKCKGVELWARIFFFWITCMKVRSSTDDSNCGLSVDLCVNKGPAEPVVIYKINLHLAERFYWGSGTIVGRKLCDPTHPCMLYLFPLM